MALVKAVMAGGLALAIAGAAAQAAILPPPVRPRPRPAILLRHIRTGGFRDPKQAAATGFRPRRRVSRRRIPAQPRSPTSSNSSKGPGPELDPTRAFTGGGGAIRRPDSFQSPSPRERKGDFVIISLNIGFPKKQTTRLLQQHDINAGHRHLIKWPMVALIVVLNKAKPETCGDICDD
jgi:hypothetical protein